MSKVGALGSLGALHAALRLRHAKDVLVEECNLGSAAAGCRRMDAWALLKTWSPWTTIGYEIKVDRQDFLRDRKWVEYLPVCHELYFVCPPKLIAPEELPAEVGLLCGTGGQRLVTRRKAVRRQPDAGRLQELMSYVLMSRARIVGDMWEAARSGEDNGRAQWVEWLEQRAEDRRLGQRVSGAVRETVNAALSKARRAEERAASLEGIQQRLAAMGLGDCTSAYQVERRLTDTNATEIRRLAESILRLVPDTLRRVGQESVTR